MQAHRLRRRLSSACALGLVLADQVSVSVTGRGAEQDPVLVGVEFRAVVNGVPVSDLRLDEITVRIGNVERQVRALDLIRLDGAGAQAPFATNLASRRGRDVIFAIDEDSLPPGGEALLRDALTVMLGTLTPRDRAGLVSLHPSGPSVALGPSHASLRAAIPLVRGRAIGPESAAELSCRTRRLLPALASLMRGLDAGVTTTVLLFSAALAAPGPTAVPARGAESGCLLLPTDFDEFRAAATRSAAQLYAIHLADGSPGAATLADGAGLERLAGQVGGRFVRMTGDPTAPITAIALETSSVYVASIALPADVRRGTTHPIDLRVRRDAVTTRVRPELVTPPVETRTVSPRDMMRASAGYRDLPLRSAAFPSRHTAQQARVIVLFEPVESSVALTSAMVGAFNARGQLVTQWTSAREDIGNRPVAAALVLEPGPYRLRVAAVDARGRSGAVDEDLLVELPRADPATTSAVVLGTTSAGGFSPRLQFTASDRSGTAYLELYGVSCAAVSGRLEVMRSEPGPALSSSAATTVPIEQSDGCMVVGEFDLAALPASDYVLRIELRLGGQVIGRQHRTFRKADRQ